MFGARTWLLCTCILSMKRPSNLVYQSASTTIYTIHIQKFNKFSFALSIWLASLDGNEQPKRQTTQAIWIVRQLCSQYQRTQSHTNTDQFSTPHQSTLHYTTPHHATQHSTTSTHKSCRAQKMCEQTSVSDPALAWAQCNVVATHWRIRILHVRESADNVFKCALEWLGVFRVATISPIKCGRIVIIIWSTRPRILRNAH